MVLYVKTHSRCIYSFREPEEFSSWEEDNLFTVDDVTASQEDSWQTGYDVFPDENGYVHVVYITYGEGDSFGHSSGNGDIVYVFQDRALAEKAQRLLKEDRESFSKDILLDNGDILKYGDPSTGYFECLESCEIRSFKVI